ncbi:GNAT family N-acetyltransferase [Chryseolinea lacunae]|uniref:GNAT family N-acetyltransferase n=1 Tax=Chryseolinea lacunae TaxID=2801331 RepID=A0ABS1KTB8_9BACT|nr:N-acetyltransferase [Chryseolinea lacunae]MBL0742609.1 GNAT family N-acetyltransferase [Chryseolinea lacunae]
MRYRTATEDDAPRLLKLYKAVSRVPDGIARLEHEVTEEYVENFLYNSLSSGLIIVAENPDKPEELVADVHGYKMGLEVFKHVISDVTLCVHPNFQGRKIGRTILMVYLEEIATNRPDIGKVELIAREGNLKAIQLYQSVGFLIEGRLEMRIRNVDGTYEADIPMGWQNPNFEFDEA